ncbi:MAG TPA: DUF2066 domain-containing protein [Alphaproteobacteria bacterium]|nr:DUF2066 domain-containing protein [Alphaproteobacteria bacterium]
MLQRFAPFAVLLALVAGFLPTAAQENDGGIFTVSGVEVDVTAGTSLEAREQAFSRGQRLAFGRLLERFGVDPSRLDPSSLSEVEMAQLLQGFQVTEENTSAGRYVATLTYDFRPQEVRELLRSRAIDFAETRSKPVVVVPIYQSEFGPRLWDSPNPWLDAWLDLSGQERLVPIVVPFGDLQDVLDVTIEEALAGDSASLQTIADRYGAGSALVAVAEPRGSTLSVTLDHYGAELGDSTTRLSIDDGADEQALMAAAVSEVATRLEDAWRAQARVQSGERNTIALLVPLAGGDDWFAIQSRLRQVPTVVETRVVSLSPQEAIVELDYIGDEQQFRLALSQQDLSIQQGFYAPQLRLAGAEGTLPR